MRPRIGICGFGFVGKAVTHGFCLHSDMKIYDKFQTGLNTLEETVKESDYLFVCVPTPMRDDGSQDLSCIYDVMESINELNISNKIIIIKSTVIPGTTRMISEKYPTHHFVFNPEFLTERSAKLDFINSSRIVLGGSKQMILDSVEEMYRVRFTHTPIYKTTFEGAELVKYMNNCFFALKISYLNEIYDIAKRLNIPYDQLKKMFLADQRIGNSHTDIPGHDGSRGYGGKCIGSDEYIFIKSNYGIKPIKISELYNKFDSNDSYKILSWNEKNNKIEWDNIVNIGKRIADNIINVKGGILGQCNLTDDHPVFSNKGLLELKDVENILSLNNSLPSGNRLEYINLYELFKDEKIYKNMKILLNDIELNNFKDNIKDISKKLLSDKLISRDVYYSINNGIIDNQIFKKYFEYLGFDFNNIFIKAGRSTPKINSILNIDEDFMFLLGVYLAEGCYSKIDNIAKKIILSLGYHEDLYIGEVFKVLKNLGFKYTTNVQNWKNKPSCRLIKITPSMISFLFQKIFECGDNCYNKRIPDFCFNLDNKLKQKLLQGYFCGDGSYKNGSSKYIGIQCATVSNELSQGLLLLLKELNIIPRIYFRNKTNYIEISGIENLKKSKFLFLQDGKNVISEAIDKYERNIKPMSYFVEDEYLYGKISDVKDIEDDYVYSIETEKNHTFIMTNGIIVHNCFPKDINALIKWGEKHGFSMDTCRSAEVVNNRVRKNKDWEQITGATTKNNYKE